MLSDRSAGLLTQGIEETSHLLDNLSSELESLVQKYSERLQSLSLLSVTMKQVQTEHANPSDYTPEVLRSRVQGYLNVLVAIRKPIEHDGAFWETMIHDALHALEGTEHFDRAFAAYKKNLDASRKPIV